MNGETGRVLGLDFGSERIGAAISDDTRTVATPLEVIPGRDRVRADERIRELIGEWEVTLVVIGMPYSLDGSSGPATRTVEAVIKRLGATISPPIVTYDERLTTVTAHRSLDEQNVAGHKRRDMVDMVAAQVILQGWMDRIGND